MSTIDMNKYDEFAYLITDGYEDDNGEYHERSLEDWVEDTLEFSPTTTRNFYISMYTCKDYRNRANRAVGFRDTIFFKSTNPRYKDNWGYVRSSIPFVVVNGEFNSNEVVNVIRDVKARSGYHGIFLEDIEWDQELQTFKISVGS